MKRIVIAAMLIMLHVGFLHASNDTRELYQHFKLSREYDDYVGKFNDTVDLINEVVPYEFRNYFINYTKDIPELRIVLLAMAKQESADWSSMRSYEINANGSYDYGPIGLNEFNIKNKDFRKAYFPKENIDNVNVVYMIASINYFRDLYNEFGFAAVYPYNCGRSKYMHNNIPKKTYAYYKAISSNTVTYETILRSLRKNFVIKHYYNKNLQTSYDVVYTVNPETRQIHIQKFQVIIHKLPYTTERKIRVPEPNYIIDSGVDHDTLLTFMYLLNENKA